MWRNNVPGYRYLCKQLKTVFDEYHDKMAFDDLIHRFFRKQTLSDRKLRLMLARDWETNADFTMIKDYPELYKQWDDALNDEELKLPDIYIDTPILSCTMKAIERAFVFYRKPISEETAHDMRAVFLVLVVDINSTSLKYGIRTTNEYLGHYNENDNVFELVLDDKVVDYIVLPEPPENKDEESLQLYIHGLYETINRTALSIIVWYYKSVDHIYKALGDASDIIRSHDFIYAHLHMHWIAEKNGIAFAKDTTNTLIRLNGLAKDAVDEEEFDYDKWLSVFSSISDIHYQLQYQIRYGNSSDYYYDKLTGTIFVDNLNQAKALIDSLKDKLRGAEDTPTLASLMDECRNASARVITYLYDNENVEHIVDELNVLSKTIVKAIISYDNDEESKASIDFIIAAQKSLMDLIVDKCDRKDYENYYTSDVRRALRYLIVERDMTDTLLDSEL